jgi:GAF domain-containing protein
LCEVNRRLATFGSLDELLAYATSQTRDLFDAEGCALLLVDEAAREFRFPVSSQSATSGTSPTRLGEVRFPITHGVAGWVLANARAVFIDDAQHDPRFYGGVDKTTGSVTRSMLAAPLRTSAGTIGVIEVINPAAVGDADLGFLEALGTNIAVAHERAAFLSALRNEAAGLRRLARLGGATLVALGIGVVLATALAHGARALPMRELLTGPGVLLGTLIAIAGLVLVGWVRRVSSTT